MPLRADYLRKGRTRSPLRAVLHLPGSCWILCRGQLAIASALLSLLCLRSSVAMARGNTNAAPPYPANVQKILTTYCYDCHGDGMEKGKVAFDQFHSHEEMLARKEVF